jgi:hypothetical protein
VGKFIVFVRGLEAFGKATVLWSDVEVLFESLLHKGCRLVAFVRGLADFGKTTVLRSNVDGVVFK